MGRMSERERESERERTIEKQREGLGLRKKLKES